jgi:DNA-directed RNA polymerase subunit D
MKIEKLNEDKKNYKIQFMLKDSNEVFANTVRRLIVEEVPTLAVEDLEIKDNSTALYDEMIGLRLGLTPIKTDLKSYRLPENEDEITEKSARCTLQIKLKASRKGYVYAEDAQSSDPECTFVYPKMPITKLLAKQKIDIQMTAVMGQGKDHIKWAPGWAFFKKEPVVNVGKIKSPEKLQEVCTDGVFTIKGSSVTLNKDKVNGSKLLEFYAGLEEGITVDYTNNFIFTLEGWGQLNCKEMLIQSAEILVTKADEMEQLL